MLWTTKHTHVQPRRMFVSRNIPTNGNMEGAIVSYEYSCVFIVVCVSYMTGLLDKKARSQGQGQP